MSSLYVNPGEIIIEPFWDPKLNDIDSWSLEGSCAVGVEVKKNWCDLYFGWGSGSKEKPCLRMTKRYESMICKVDDYLVVSILAPEDSKVVVEVETDSGIKKQETDPFGEIKKEIRVALSDSNFIEAITIEVYSEHKGAAYGYIQWIGLENEEELNKYLSRFDLFSSQWTGYLQDENYEPTYESMYGLIANDDELSLLRMQYGGRYDQDETGPYHNAVEGFIHDEPETMIGDFVNFWTDRRFCRERDYKNRLTQKAPLLATAGIMLRDKHLLRLAARYVMSIAMCTKWNDSFITNTLGSDWEHRAFVKSIIGYEVGIVLDLAGEMFTEAGRDFVLRRLAEDVIGSTNFITWKHDYIYDNNQMAWFSHGRLMTYAILEQHYNNVKPYTDIAYEDLVENMNAIFYEDGGYGEGPSYLSCIGDHALFAIYIYARLRHKEFWDMVPEKAKKTGNFIEAMSSTCGNQDAVPVCDGRPVLPMSTIVNFTYLSPDSYWNELLRKALIREPDTPTDLMTYKLLSQIEGKRVVPKAFIQLEAMGMVSSYRLIGEKAIKIIVFGNKAFIDHQHEDKGQFVIEFAGETYAMDPGNFDYASSYSYLVKLAEYHNVSVPYGDFEMVPGPERPNTKDVYARGSGDEMQFYVEVDLSDTWAEYYRSYRRKLTSDRPDYLQIEDAYELKSGLGIDFGWNTELDVSIAKGKVVIEGKNGQAVITVPQDITVTAKQLPKFDQQSQTRIGFRKEGVSGRIQLDIEFVSK